MIANERQYRITKAWVDRFEHGAAHAEEAAAGLDPLLRQAMRDQYEAQAQELRAQRDDYDALRAGRIATASHRASSDLPNALIEARMAPGWPTTEG